MARYSNALLLGRESLLQTLVAAINPVLSRTRIPSGVLSQARSCKILTSTYAIAPYFTVCKSF